MSSFKILVVEDEMIVAADISMMLERLGYEVTGISARGEDALKSLESTRPDLILMDISLKGKLDGIETAILARDLFDTPVIFLTANSDDATFEKAKSARPLAFLSKPFRQSELQRAIELAKIQLEKDAPLRAEPTDAEADEPVFMSDRIFVRHKDRLIKIMLEDIHFAEADRNYCRIRTADGEHLLSLPLGAFEEKLASSVFMRIHRSHIVNVSKIDAIHDNFGTVSIGKQTLAVSKNFQDALAQRLRVI